MDEKTLKQIQGILVGRMVEITDPLMNEPIRGICSEVTLVEQRINVALGKSRAFGLNPKTITEESVEGPFGGQDHIRKVQVINKETSTFRPVHEICLEDITSSDLNPETVMMWAKIYGRKVIAPQEAIPSLIAAFNFARANLTTLPYDIVDPAIEYLEAQLFGTQNGES